MPFINKILNLFFTRRRADIERFMRHPAQVQSEQLQHLLDKGRQTKYGRDHGLERARGAEDLARLLPVCGYEDLEPYIMCMRAGEPDVLWPGRVKWFAKSSGTTSSKSKYIPVTEQGLKSIHMQGPKDTIAFFCAEYPDSGVFNGKTLTLGGSKRIEKEGESVFCGDLSAILIENTPSWANLKRVPSVETALTPDFTEKVRRICRETVGENVTCLAGVPSWNLVMLQKVLEYTGKDNLLEVWPYLELFIHGGMNFLPYRKEYDRIIPSPQMKYMETYNASEGFFAVAEKPGDDDMLLMLDYDTYYEFLPVGELDDPGKAVPVEGVTTGRSYAMIITTGNGLWRYMIGDTVEFTSLSPYKIRITGRTKHHINVFGEEVMVDNAEKALHAACESTGASVAEYTVAPVYMHDGKRGAHEWIVEFNAPPSSPEAFIAAVDDNLQCVNSDYEAKRSGNATLDPPRLTVVPEGTFLQWMASRGKTGGQNKVPRLSNSREYADQLRKLID